MKPIIYYASGAIASLITTFTLPKADKIAGAFIPASMAEIYFGISSLVFLVLFTVTISMFIDKEYNKNK